VQAKPVSDSCAVLTHWMGLADANSAGNIHGGSIMKLADEAAALAAIKHARQRVVTVGIDRMDFLVPIYVGELVTFRATVNAAWRTSMEVGVRVEAENPRTGERHHTNTAYLTMVALDEGGRPAEVPPLEAVSPDEQRRMREAELRRVNRLEERAEILARRAQERD
jgi:acyl-CoA hydrolase